MYSNLKSALRKVIRILDALDGKHLVRACIGGYEVIISPLAPDVKDEITVRSVGER